MPWKNRVKVTPGFCILWAYLLMVLPLRVLIAAAAAAWIHELCHMLTIRMTGGRIMTLTVGAGGMVMETEPMSPGWELVCSLAGPMGSFLLASMGRWLPYLSACAFIQGCFNLLPLYPLDGGRAVRCLAGLLRKIPCKEKRLGVQ